MGAASNRVRILNKTVALAIKDLRSETRAREIAPAMVLFALALVFLFTFALPAGSGRAPVPEPLAGAVSTREIAGTFLWIALLFAGITGFGRSAANDMQQMEALLLAPVDPASLFVGKALANFAFLSFLELALLPFFVVFLDIRAGSIFPGIFLVGFVANAGMAAVGTLFGAGSQYARSRSLIMPLLSFPVLLPLILGASRLTSSLLIAGSIRPEARWLGLMTIFDVVMISLGLVLFEFVVQE